MQVNPSFVRRATCTSLAASMLLSACGGGDVVGDAAAPPPDVPIVQPAWASLGVLVAPGQASKVFNLTGCSGEGAVGTFVDASLTVLANGDVSFKAATVAGGVQTELFAMQQSETTSRESRFYAGGGVVNYIDYDQEADTEDGGEKSFSLYAGEGQGFYAKIDREGFYQDIYCTGGVTVASLVPAAAFLPSEARVAASYLAGVDGVDEESLEGCAAARIISGAFYWRTDCDDVGRFAKVAEALSDFGSGPGASLNLTNGQLFNSSSYNPATGFEAAPAPAPTRVTFSAALMNGSFTESFQASNSESPEARFIDLEIDGSEELRNINYELTRIGNRLFVGDYFDKRMEP